MDSLFSFFSNKKPVERPDPRIGDDDEEPTTTEYYSGASDSGSDIESHFKEPAVEVDDTQFELDLGSRRNSQLILNREGILGSKKTEVTTRPVFNANTFQVKAPEHLAYLEWQEQNLPLEDSPSFEEDRGRERSEEMVQSMPYSCFSPDVCLASLNLEISLCGTLINMKKMDRSKIDLVFEENKLSYEDFMNILINNALAINGRDMILKVNDRLWISSLLFTS